MNTYKNYIDLIRNILKNFDNEFDNIRLIILQKIFDDYYMNGFEKIYNIDDIFKNMIFTDMNYQKRNII